MGVVRDTEIGKIRRYARHPSRSIVSYKGVSGCVPRCNLAPHATPLAVLAIPCASQSCCLRTHTLWRKGVLERTTCQNIDLSITMEASTRIWTIMWKGDGSPLSIARARADTPAAKMAEGPTQSRQACFNDALHGMITPNAGTQLVHCATTPSTKVVHLPLDPAESHLLV